MQKLKILITSTLITVAGYSQAQSSLHQYSRFSLKTGLGNQVIGFPFQNLGVSFHPAILVGAEYKLNKSVKHTFAIASTSFFFENKTIGHGFSTSLDLSRPEIGLQ